jgi:hypothetical protein
VTGPRIEALGSDSVSGEVHDDEWTCDLQVREPDRKVANRSPKFGHIAMSHSIMFSRPWSRTQKLGPELIYKDELDKILGITGNDYTPMLKR